MNQIDISFKVKCGTCDGDLEAFFDYRQHELSVNPCAKCCAIYTPRPEVYTFITKADVINGLSFLMEGRTTVEVEYNKPNGDTRFLRGRFLSWELDRYGRYENVLFLEDVDGGVQVRALAVSRLELITRDDGTEYRFEL